MKSPESCESSLRNRKKKENVSVKNSLKSPEKMEDLDLKEVEQPQEKDSKVDKVPQLVSKDAPKDSNFRIRFEFDPMSIALLALAIITRFFKLSEPRNVV